MARAPRARGSRVERRAGVLRRGARRDRRLDHADAQPLRPRVLARDDHVRGGAVGREQRRRGQRQREAREPRAGRRRERVGDGVTRQRVGDRGVAEGQRVP